MVGPADSKAVLREAISSQTCSRLPASWLETVSPREDSTASSTTSAADCSTSSTAERMASTRRWDSASACLAARSDAAADASARSNSAAAAASEPKRARSAWIRLIEALSWEALGPDAEGRPDVVEVKVAARLIAGIIPPI